ncbi:MAG: hypothetical protein Q9205_004425, partial [Flavoplaca limonia]
SGDDSLLPMTHLTPKTLLGGATEERETLGQLYAAQIASLIASKNPHEKRTVMVGLGLSKIEASREDFYNTIDLVGREKKGKERQSGLPYRGTICSQFASRVAAGLTSPPGLIENAPRNIPNNPGKHLSKKCPARSKAK